MVRLKKINKFIKNIIMNKEQLVTDFNNVSIEFIKQLSLICPDSVITSNAGLVEKVLNNPTSKNVVIDQFALNVLDYKKNIDNFDEDFFISNSFDKHINDNQVLMQLMSDLKNMWLTLNSQNKKSIFEYLQVLCYYANEYLLLITA